ncbi:penicillin-binding protein 1B [Halioxenophilus sp. WMMB6]|uniref:penicillin-binding protein 1B n=1 Tax=Halioxenophilus sp. WMMB6 TaxID=3073815 RepID=UPI00295EE7EB|nr:penicillin-binding protein 1B [Halioxenophilus sp. WMMB6]
MVAKKSPSRRKKAKPRARSRKKSSSPLRGLLLRVLAWGICLALVLVAGVWAWLDYSVRNRFDGARWELAARLYARPLELYQGASLSREMLQLELQGLNYRPVKQVHSPGEMRWQGHTLDLYRRSFTIGQQSYPAERIQLTLAEGELPVVANLYARDSIFTLEPQEIGAIYPASGEDRILTRLQEIPPLLGETLLAVEDRNFMHHNGVSLKAIARAMWANLRAGGLVQGGSTLTQQLVKNMFLSNERSLSRKLTEAAMTLSLEWHYSKSEILEAYLNEVYLGQSGSRAIHGFALAAQFYFNKPVADLNTQEIALLVGLVKGASFYNPWQHPERALARRTVVLQVMGDTGLISGDEMGRAKAQPLGLVSSPTSQHAFPAFVGLVKAQLLRDYPLSLLQSEGLQIYTTLAPSVQILAEQAVAKELGRLERDYDLPASSLQVGAVITAVGSAEVEAAVGDRNPRYHGFNRVLDARRPIGSLVKPALYATALKEGYTLASILDDGPVAYTQDTGAVWAPKNFTDTDHGLIPLYQALANSYNQAAARLGLEVGVDEVIDTLHSLGLAADIPELPSVLLGAVDLSPVEVSNYFHTLANEGIYTPLRAIREVYSAEGERLQRYPLTAREGIDSETAYLIDFALQITAHQGTGRGLYNALPESLSLAAKTGTTNDQRDSWFASYSGSDLAVVWVGQDDNQALPFTGATGALPVWRNILEHLPTESIARVKPGAIDYFWVDASTGLLSGPDCRGAILLPLRRGSEPEARAACNRLQQRRNPWWRRLWE